MPITIIDHGENNIVELDAEHLQHGDGKIELHGNDNIVRIGKPWGFGKISIQLWSGSKILIGPDCEIHLLRVFAPRGAPLTVGERTTFNGIVEFHMTEDRGVTIGQQCLIGAETFFWPSDMHSVISVETGRRINQSKEIVLGDRVWVAARSIVLKGSKIGSGSVIGAGSILAGEIPENCIAAGNPAKVIKQNTTWDRELLEIHPEPPLQPTPKSPIAYFRALISTLQTRLSRLFRRG